MINDGPPNMLRNILLNKNEDNTVRKYVQHNNKDFKL